MKRSSPRHSPVKISQQRLDASVRRILEAEGQAWITEESPGGRCRLERKTLRGWAWQAESQEISDHGITLLRDTPHRLPLDGAKPARALLVCLYADPEPYPGEDLERELRKRFDSVATLRARHKILPRAENIKLPAPDSYENCDSGAVRPPSSDRKGRRGRPGRPVSFDPADLQDWQNR